MTDDFCGSRKACDDTMLAWNIKCYLQTVKMKGLGAANSGAAAGSQIWVFDRGQHVKVSPEGHGSINSALDLTKM